MELTDMTLAQLRQKAADLGLNPNSRNRKELAADIAVALAQDPPASTVEHMRPSFTPREPSRQSGYKKAYDVAQDIQFGKGGKSFFRSSHTTADVFPWPDSSTDGAAGNRHASFAGGATVGTRMNFADGTATSSVGSSVDGTRAAYVPARSAYSTSVESNHASPRVTGTRSPYAAPPGNNRTPFSSPADRPRTFSRGHPGELPVPASTESEYPSAVDQDARARQVAQMIAAGTCVEIAGMLEVMPEGFGFLRTQNYSAGHGSQDAYVSAAQIRKFGLRPGDHVQGQARADRTDRAVSMLQFDRINDKAAAIDTPRCQFDQLTPQYPATRVRLGADGNTALRLIDLIAPLGLGARGLIAAPPKCGKTMLLREIARSVTQSHPDLHLFMLLVDGRPEEVTELRQDMRGELISSTFDEGPEHHVRVTEMVLERARRLVEQGRDVMILLDSITKLTRAYSLTTYPTGRALPGGLDAAALTRPKRFLGSARSLQEGGSLTILATALTGTGNLMDDTIFEELKSGANWELHLTPALLPPSVDLRRSSTRNQDHLLTPAEREGQLALRRAVENGQEQHVMALVEKNADDAEFFAKLAESIPG